MARHPFGSRKIGRDRLTSDHASSRGRARDAGEYKGLCVNCANRETCLLPKSEGGVWHCEEYVEES
jgi:hypothetical protein